MNAEAHTDPADIAWSFWRQLGEGEIEAALALLADDGIYWVNTADDRSDRPMARMKAFFRKNMRLVPMRFVRHDTLTDGDRVVLELESFGETELGTYNNRYCFVMTVRDGLIVRINEYVDTHYAAQALVPLLRAAPPPVDGV